MTTFKDKMSEIFGQSYTPQDGDRDEAMDTWFHNLPADMLALYLKDYIQESSNKELARTAYALFQE